MRKHVKLAAVALGFTTMGAAGTRQAPAARGTLEVRYSSTMRFEAEGWREGEAVPASFTCDGENRVPEVHWSDVPPGTKSLALALVDPDAPGGLFVHWLLFNVPPEAGHVGGSSGTLPTGSQEGTNNFGGLDYGGPCPPHGKPHHYRMELYALDQRLKLSDGVTYRHVKKAMGGHVLAEAHVTSVFQR